MGNRILEAITKEDCNMLKDSLLQMAKDQIKKDLSEYYLLSNSDFSSIMQDLLEEIKDELKAEIKSEYGELIKQEIVKSLKL